jgi:uncharacterized protein (DUF302 family)
MTDYAIQSKLALSFDEALARAPDALAKEGFGILTQVDVTGVFAQKLQLPFRRYRILGACNPSLAHRALSGTLLAGVMIPCNVILWENDDLTSTIAAVDPVEASAAQAEPAIGELARDVRERLLRVFGHIAA